MRIVPWLWLAAALLLLVPLSGTARAGDPAADPTPNAAPDDRSEVMVFGGMEVLRIRVGWNGMTPRERVQATRERLIALSEKAGRANHRVTAEDITLDTSSGTPQIRVGGTLILTVTKADALANHTSLHALARVWHTRLREAILRAAPVPQDEP